MIKLWRVVLYSCDKRDITYVVHKTFWASMSYSLDLSLHLVELRRYATDLHRAIMDIGTWLRKLPSFLRQRIIEV